MEFLVDNRKNIEEDFGVLISSHLTLTMNVKLLHAFSVQIHTKNLGKLRITFPIFCYFSAGSRIILSIFLTSLCPYYSNLTFLIYIGFRITISSKYFMIHLDDTSWCVWLLTINSPLPIGTKTKDLISKVKWKRYSIKRIDMNFI